MEIWNKFVYILLFCFVFCSSDRGTVRQEENFFPKKTGTPDPVKVEQLKRSLESWLSYQNREKVFPSVGVAVIKGNELVYKYTVATTDKTNYGLGSITKTFTATMILRAVEQGLIELDAPVSKYIPGLVIEREELKSRPVTIRNLLSHTSGMPDLRYHQGAEYQDTKTTGLSFAITKQVYPAGFHYRYSNHGFQALGEVLTRVYNKPLYEVVKEQLFEPIGMEFSAVGNGVHGAGGISTNVIDLGRYASMWLNQGKSINGMQVLSSKSVHEMIKPQTHIPFTSDKRYCGLGWRAERDKDGVVTFFHIGGANYVAAWVQMFPKYDVAILYLSNPPEYDDHLMDQLLIMQRKLGDLATAIVGAEIPLYKMNSTAPSIEVLQKYAGNYKSLLTGQKVTVNFDKDRIFLQYDSGSRTYLSPYTTNVFGGPGGYGSYEFAFNTLTNEVMGFSSYQGYYERIRDENTNSR